MKFTEKQRIISGQKQFKQSLVAGIALVTLTLVTIIGVDQEHAYASSTDTEISSTAVLDSSATAGTIEASSTSTLNSSTSSSNTPSSAASSAAKIASSASAVQVSASFTSSVASSSTTASEVATSASTATTLTRVSQPSVTAPSAQNAGRLDSTTIQGNQLEVSGWHATNYAEGRDYDFVIVYDVTTKKEITRQQIQPVQRNDVASVYPKLANASKSGFQANFDLTDAMAGDQIQIISRYSANAMGNSDYVDYWFTPIIFNKNYGRLDSAKITGNGDLQVSGWHAADRSIDKDTHFLIVFDSTTNQQISVASVKNTQRADIKKVYPGVYNEDNAGFSSILSLKNVNLSHDIKLVSRYSSSNKGNGNQGQYVDYWFSVPKFDQSNRGNLESFTFNGGTKLQVVGWNATNLSAGKDNHFIILFDKTTGKQVASTTSSVKRNDVAQTYKQVATAANSGFSTQFNFSSSLVGHDLVVVSRYSSDASGNGSNGQYVDYWFEPKTFNSENYSVDHFNVTKNNTNVHVDGWFASDQAAGKNNMFIIVINKITGKEVARTKATYIKRNDVSKAFSNIYNSNMSGFSVDIPVTSGMSGEPLQFVLRSTGSSDGNSNYHDMRTGTYQMPSQNKGSFDSVNVNMDTSNMAVSGWHAADGSYLKNYEYLIVTDLSGHELTRVKVNNSHQLRNDVLGAYSKIYNAQYSGFSANITITSAMKNKFVKIIDRFTDDANGNGNYVDYYSGQIAIGVVYNVTANGINAYITNNHLSHATIQTQIWSGYPTDSSMLYENGYGSPEGVVIHETANYGNDSIPMEMSYAQNHYENAFVHSYVSDAQIINVANTNYKCWGSGAQGNKRFVQFEQIEVHSKTAFAYELNNAAYYTAYLLDEYKLTPSLCTNGSGTVWSHHDVSTYLGNTDHTDPDGYWATNAKKYFGTSYSMTDFFELVKYYFAQL